MARAVAFVLALTLVAPAAAGAAAWRWPLDGPVAQRFHVVADRYARGQHRGIDIAARPGTTVRAACAGRVRFAGPAGTNGRTVSVRCGRLVATYTQLAAVAVTSGQRLRAGERVGLAGSHLHLGARRATDRTGYIDPLALLGDPSPPGPGPLPLRQTRPPGPLGPAPRPAPRPAPARPRRLPLAARGAAPSRPTLPWPAIAGLILLLPVATLPLLRGRPVPRGCGRPRRALALRGVSDIPGWDARGWRGPSPSSSCRTREPRRRP